MLRRFLAATGLLAVVVLTGCAQCQDCFDWDGPVSGQESLGAKQGPRAGSASATVSEVSYEDTPDMPELAEPSE